MTNEEKYKLALFAVIRNSIVMQVGLRQGRSKKEINSMSVGTLEEILKICDYEGLIGEYKEGVEEE